MKKRLLIITALAFLCGCSYKENSEQLTETVTSESITEMTESMTVTFAETEPSETAAPETSQTEATTVLKENQLEYRDKNIAVLMEFTGAESLLYHPHALALPNYRDDDYVLHSVFTVENLSKKSFDFIPQKMIIRGSNNNSQWDMLPVTENDTGLTVSDKYYTVGPGESVSFEIDFVGERGCIEYAEEIVYGYIGNFSVNNIDYTELNNVTAAEGLHLTKRSAIKKAVSNALEITESKPLPFQFVPSDGDYQLNTEKNSYCFTAEKLRPDGYVCDYIKVSLKVAALTGEPEVFEPNKFMLVRSDGKTKHVLDWGFDEALVSIPKVQKVIKVNGVPVTLYEYPFDLYLRPDGTAEYDMYFDINDGEEYVKFVYDGENDSFEKEIEVK
ncbi:MAG: hypothetical protein ACI4J0_00090 [Huintestinicola sp.]|uniref:hypothetical protein n=1 Tax=Huintestinicola sp. TaxID=2981661 RepID=UPI003F04F378